MNTRSIKMNYIFNTLLIVSNMLFPIITFPYVSRILGPIGIGKVAFAQSVSQYFIMIAQAGIPVYGLKEVAKVRDDNLKLSKLFSELFIINFLLTLLSIAVYFSLFLFVDKIEHEKELFLILGLGIIINLFSFDWFYSGLEEFRYITIRSLFVRVISVLLIFVLIHNEADYTKYAALGVVSIVLANIYNVVGLRRYITLRFKNINIKNHIRPLSLLFLAGVITSVYWSLDVILLGSIAGDKYAGFYSTNRRITLLAITLVGALGTVLIPRLSYYINNNMKEEYNRLAEKSINFIYFCAFPMVIYIIVMSKELLLLFGGEKFLLASVSLSIISVQVLATSLVDFFRFQVFLPHNDEKSIIKSNAVGALVNLCLNLLLIRSFHQNASSLAIVISEITVVVAQFVLATKYINFKLFNNQSGLYLKATFILSIALIIFKLCFVGNFITSIVVSVLLSAIIYLGYLLLKKEEFSMMIIYKLIEKKSKQDSEEERKSERLI